jgi:hypothetical protein
MARQTFGAVWSWAAGKLPMYKLPVVEVTSNTTLDSSVHNGRVLVCSSPVTLTPAFTTMGSGFSCNVLNLSSGSVMFGAGITTSTGQNTLPPGQAAALLAISYSQGNVVYAAILSGPSTTSSATGTQVTQPGQVTSLSASSIQTTSLQLSWSPPLTGGTPSSYTVQYATSGSASWSTYASGVTGTTLAITGLAVGTSYNFQVFAVNSAGSGVPSAAASATTQSTAKSVLSITWNLVPNAQYSVGNGAIGVNVHVSPSSSAVQFGLSTSSTIPPTSWTAGTYVNTDLWGVYLAVPSQAGTYYVWCEGTDGSQPTVYPTAITVS